MRTPLKAHQFSIAASVLAALAIAAVFLGNRNWTPSEQERMISAFLVMYALLTYLVVQIVAHILYGPASRKQMLVDTLSSLLPVGTVLYILAEYARGDLALSGFQLHVALLIGYGMALDLLVDIGLMLWPQRTSVVQFPPSSS